MHTAKSGQWCEFEAQQTTHHLGGVPLSVVARPSYGATHIDTQTSTRTPAQTHSFRANLANAIAPSKTKRLSKCVVTGSVGEVVSTGLTFQTPAQTK